MTEEIIRFLKRNRVSTTEVADCLEKSGALEGVLPINRGHYRVGRVKWVYAYSDSNYPVHDMVRDTQEGEIVFIEVFDCGKRAIIGDLVSKYILLYRQASAIVCTGPFRDAASLIKENYPIWCTRVTPVGCFNTKPEPDLAPDVRQQHMEMYDGAIAVCDDCGVVMIPRACHTPEFIKRLEDIENQEDIWFDRLDHYKEDTLSIVCLKTYLQDEK